MAFQPQPATPTSAAPPCQACEALLPDALDGVLTPADQAWFDAHLSTCAACSDMVADAQRGAAWLEILKTPRPEPSPALLARILAQTQPGTNSGARGLAPETWVVAPRIPVHPHNVLPFRPHLFTPVARLLETRLAMTAAMAFFSIALTLNLTGVRLNQFHASDLRPANLRNTWFQATAQAHRSYDNARVVRVFASRVASVRENLRDEPDATPEPAPNKPATPDGSTRLTLTHKQGGLA